MTKQEYSINKEDGLINITKSGQIIYRILLTNKSINLKELYDGMKVDIDDELVLRSDIEKVNTPQNDSERIFNNVYDFMDLLINNINEKLKLLREKQDTSIFK